MITPTLTKLDPADLHLVEDDEEESDPEELIEEDYSTVNLTTTGTSSC